MHFGRLWPIYRWILAVLLVVNSIILLLSADTFSGSAVHSVALFMGAFGIIFGLIFLIRFVMEYMRVRRVC